MTEPPQDRDGPPTVAALAIHVNGLRRTVEALANKVGSLASTQQEHTTVLDDIAELRRQVEQILGILTDERDASPSAWFWLTMTEHEREQQLGELSDWVDTVLRTQYPNYLAEQIRPCWPNHPEARWELAWLYRLWSLAYLVKRPEPKDAADWHDRWSPGVLRRLRDVMSQCEGTCQRQSGLRATEAAQRRAPL